jgi:hypothetical protein
VGKWLNDPYKKSGCLYSISSVLRSFGYVATTTSVSATSVTRPYSTNTAGGGGAKPLLRRHLHTQPPIQDPNNKPKCFICKFFKVLKSKLSLLLFLIFNLIILFILVYVFKDDIYIYLTTAMEKPEIRLELVNTILNFITLISFFLVTSLLHLPNHIINFLENVFIYNYFNISNDDDTTTISSDIQDLSIDTEINNLLLSESKDKTNNMDVYEVDGDKTNNMDVCEADRDETNNMDVCEADRDETNNIEELRSSDRHPEIKVGPVEEESKYIYGSSSSSLQTPQAENNSLVSTEQQPQATQYQNAATTANSTATETSITSTNNEVSKATHSSLYSDTVAQGVGVGVHTPNPASTNLEGEESTNTDTKLIGGLGSSSFDPFDGKSTIDQLMRLKWERSFDRNELAKAEAAAEEAEKRSAAGAQEERTIAEEQAQQEYKKWYAEKKEE